MAVLPDIWSKGSRWNTPSSQRETKLLAKWKSAPADDHAIKSVLFACSWLPLEWILCGPPGGWCGIVGWRGKEGFRLTGRHSHHRCCEWVAQNRASALPNSPSVVERKRLLSPTPRDYLSSSLGHQGAIRDPRKRSNQTHLNNEWWLVTLACEMTRFTPSTLPTMFMTSEKQDGRRGLRKIPRGW